MQYASLFHRQYLLVAAITLIVFAGCSKSDGLPEPPPPPPPPPPIVNTDPIRVIQSIRTYIHNDELVSDTTGFEYDDLGRVIKLIYENGFSQTVGYTGDKITSLKSGADNDQKEGLRESFYSADGDTIMLDLYQNSDAIDTTQLTCIYEDGLSTNFWTYLHFKSSCSCSERHLQKEKNYYNSQGNLVKTTMQTLLDSTESDMFTVTAWDDKINPKRNQPKLNSLFLSLNLPLESSSLHNPTVYKNSTTTYEVEMTYNADGYPVTFKMKNEDYVRVKLVYNR